MNIRTDLGAPEFRCNFEPALGVPSTTAHDNTPGISNLTFDWTQEDPGKAEVNAKAACFVQDEAGPETSFVTGSASVLLNSDLNVAVAVAGAECETFGSHLHGKIGLTRTFLSVGKTSFTIDYYSGDDMALAAGASGSTSQKGGAVFVVLRLSFGCFDTRHTNRCERQGDRAPTLVVQMQQFCDTRARTARIATKACAG